MDRGKRVAVIGALWVAADAESAAGPVELETVTVTATKTEHLAFEVAGSVSVVAAETIEAEQPQSLNDILKALPNIELFSGPRRLGEEANIRGFSDERIVTTLDGARQNFSIGHQGRFVLEPDLLKQVEVYRGANSALYGSGALGGVIALTTKDPSDFLEAEEILGAWLKGGFQSVNDEWLGSLAVFGRLGPSLEYLGHFSYRDSSDIKLGNGETLADSAERSIAGSGKLYWRPLPYHKLRASIDQFHTEGDFPANPQSVPSRDNEVADTDIERRTYTIGYRYDDPQNPWARIEATAYQTEIDEDLRRLMSGIGTATEFNTTGFDLRNSSRFAFGGERLRQVFAYGVEYYKDEQQGTQDRQPRGSFPDAEADVYGFYLQDEIMLFEHVSLIPGFRYDHYDLEAGAQGQRQESEISPKVGLLLHPTGWLTLWGNYAEGFRVPTLPEMFAEGLHFRGFPPFAPDNFFVPNPNLRPETTRSWEGGLRTHWDGLFTSSDKLRLQAAYFDTEARDLIDLVVDITGGTTTSRNLTNARLFGYEAELNYEALHFFAGIGYSQARGKDEDTGAPLTAIPADKLVAQLGVRDPGWGLSTGLQSRFVDRQDRVPEGVPETPGYAVYDLYASWLPGSASLWGLRVDFGIDNLTDKAYRRHLSVLDEARQNFKISVSYQF
jgi:hemoglobin/transferrin/lactoferrin receptor protein